MIKLHLKIRILIITIALLPLMSCAMIHSYDSYHGKVIDAETKQPLDGAAVLAIYYTESYGPAGTHTHYLDAQETVTNENGEFNISPLTATTFRIGHSFNPYVYFTIFKPGYGCYPKHKDVKPMFVPNATLPVNQYVIIELPSLKTKEERMKNYGCNPSVSVPEIKYINLFNLIQQERIALGLKPEKIKK